MGPVLLRRHGYVKRKGTKAARKVPDDFDNVKAAFLQNVTAQITTHKIPDDLVINFDQTGCKIVPQSDWTLEKQGSLQVALTGLEDKRQITVLMAATKSGKLLPPQLLYEGKTERCHPKDVEFPEDWHVHHSATHWSNAQTMKK